jgi:hypothetical protein
LTTCTRPPPPCPCPVCRGLYDISLTVNPPFKPPAGCVIDTSINSLPSYPAIKDRAMFCCPYPSRTMPAMCHVLPGECTCPM